MSLPAGLMQSRGIKTSADVPDAIIFSLLFEYQPGRKGDVRPKAAKEEEEEDGMMMTAVMQRTRKFHLISPFRCQIPCIKLASFPMKR